MSISANGVFLRYEVRGSASSDERLGLIHGFLFPPRTTHEDAAIRQSTARWRTEAG